MRLSLPRRVIEPEWLDDAGAEAARASLEDLQRLNRTWGGYSSLRRLLDRAVPDRDRSFTVLDVGAASGDMGREMARLRPLASVTSLDRVPHHLAAAAAPKIVGDAFQLPLADRSFDFVFSSLFLHHFSDEDVVRLFREFARVAREGVLAVDLQRHPISHAFVPATRTLLGWDPITVHDAPVSVAAGFNAPELRGLAEAAGLVEPEIWTNGFAFRLTLLGRIGPR